MGDSKGPPSLWSGPEKTIPLRRPKPQTELQENILSKSNLSADAKEWFPPSHKTVNDSSQLPSSSLQERLLKIKTGEQYNADQFAPTAEDIVGITNEASESESCYEFQQDLQHLHEIIGQIIQDPGEYDTALEIIQKIVEPYYHDVEFMAKLATLILEEALVTPHFSYPAARLCLFLEEQCGLFKPGLFLLFQKKIEEFPHNQGLTLFLAELYAQKFVEEMYGTLLLKCLKNLVQKETHHADSDNFPSSLKTACQVLKLTGQLLIDSRSKDVKYIFNQLELALNLPDSPKALIQCVINLKNSNWGRSNVTQVESNKINGLVKDVTTVPCDTDGVFYGPDGMELTMEERKWLDDLTEDGSDTDLDLNPEMDEEMRIAYRQFLRQNNST